VDLSLDFQLNYQIDFPASTQEERLAYAKQQLLQYFHQTLASIGLDRAVSTLPPLDVEPLGLPEFNIEQQRQLYQNLLQIANNEQKERADFIIQETLHFKQIPRPARKHVWFLQGRAGCGKTHTAKIILSGLISHGIKVAITATTGIAAQNYIGGQTVHQFFGFGPEVDESNDFTSPDLSSLRAILFRSLDFLCIDEVTMASGKLLSTVDATLRCVRGVDFAFGGLPTLLTGDWLQLPAIVPNARSIDVLLAKQALFQPIWNDVSPLALTISERQKGDSKFYRLLCKLAEGNSLDSSVFRTTTNVDEATLFTQPDFPTLALQSVFLCSTNLLVNQHNTRILSRFPGNSITLLSSDMADGTNTDFFTEEYMNTVNPPQLPPHALEVKIGAPIVILRNIRAAKVTNGQRGTIIDVSPNLRVLTIQIFGR
jgi:PIF1-like helicase/DNA helicase Pif1-like protein